MYLAASVLSTERDLRIDHQMAKEEAFNSLGDEACYMKDMRRRWEADLAAKDKEIEALRKKDKSMEAELYNLRAEFDAFKQQMETFQVSHYLLLFAQPAANGMFSAQRGHEAVAELLTGALDRRGACCCLVCWDRLGTCVFLAGKVTKLAVLEATADVFSDTTS